MAKAKKQTKSLVYVDCPIVAKVALLKARQSVRAISTSLKIKLKAVPPEKRKRLQLKISKAQQISQALQAFGFRP